MKGCSAKTKERGNRWWLIAGGKLEVHTQTGLSATSQTPARLRYTATCISHKSCSCFRSLSVCAPYRSTAGPEITWVRSTHFKDFEFGKSTFKGFTSRYLHGDKVACLVSAALCCKVVKMSRMHRFILYNTVLYFITCAELISAHVASLSCIDRRLTWKSVFVKIEPSFSDLVVNTLDVLVTSIDSLKLFAEYVVCYLIPVRLGCCYAWICRPLADLLLPAWRERCWWLYWFAIFAIIFSTGPCSNNAAVEEKRRFY